MATQDFDLREPPPPASDNPLHAYVRPPMALGVVTVAQFVIAILIILIAASAEPQNRAIESRLILATLLRSRYCPRAGIGLLLCRGWGWWLTAALYYCVFFDLPVNLVLWTVRGDHFSLGESGCRRRRDRHPHRSERPEILLPPLPHTRWPSHSSNAVHARCRGLVVGMCAVIHFAQTMRRRGKPDGKRLIHR